MRCEGSLRSRVFLSVMVSACFWCAMLDVASASAADGSVANGDQKILREMSRLADEDAAVRADALESLVALRDPRLPGFLESYRIGAIFHWSGRLVRCEKTLQEDDGSQSAPLSDPLTGEPLLADGEQIVVPVEELDEVSPGRRERRVVRNAIFMLEIWSTDAQKQLMAVKKCGDLRRVKAIPELEKIAADTSLDRKVRFIARESVLLIRLDSNALDLTPDDRLSAAVVLGEMSSIRALGVLKANLDTFESSGSDDDSSRKVALEIYRAAVKRIEGHQSFVQRIGYLFQGLSLGSVLVLIALGLAITFGVMKVINMAHGEMLMIGAVATWAVHEFVGPLLPEHLHNWYYVIAFPLSFLVAAAAGLLIEVVVVRHLYNRPLDSLLATIGVSFILIQTVRWWKGDNLGMSSPTWFTGGIEIVQDVILPYNRLFIIALTVFCVLFTAVMFRLTKLGMLIRATVQNRQMAMSLGVNTRMLDMCTFAYGAGLAGIAGFAIVLLSNPTPEMGQGYIVKSFLVVVVGGVGNLCGVIVSGLGLGFLEKMIEPINLSFMPIQMFDATWAQVAVLLLVVLFIQRRPSGFFPDKGRLADQTDRSEAPWLMNTGARVPRRVVLARGLIALGLLVVPVLYLVGAISPVMVNKLGMFMAFAIVAIGLDLIWGYMGVLSLCQFLFFALGGYCMGLYLANHGPKDEFGIPTCLSYVMSDVTNKQPPWFLSLFESFPVAILLGLLVPGFVALLLGMTTFMSRVRGVYFAILTQAITVGFWLVFMKNDLKMGGTNGLTNFTQILSFGIADKNLPVREDFGSYGAFLVAYAPVALVQTRFWMYITSVLMVIVVFTVARYVVGSGFGRVLVAIRDDETRLRFSGYKTWVYKTAAFALAGLFSGIGGMLYVPQKGIITPHQMTAVASIMVVVWVALGGRGTLWGAIIGAVVVNLLYDWITSFAPQYWMFALGGLFILVPLALPGGLMSLGQVAKNRAASMRSLWLYAKGLLAGGAA